MTQQKQQHTQQRKRGGAKSEAEAGAKKNGRNFIDGDDGNATREVRCQTQTWRGIDEHAGCRHY